jgi:hypothetical protein
LNQAYYDEIHIIVPTNATDVDETLPNLPIDSVQLTTVNFVLNGTPFTLEQMGLSITCNNNGDSPNPCTFYGGQQYCASLSGTPLVAGVFQMSIVVTGYVTFFGAAVEYPLTFDQYTFTVENTINVEKVSTANFQLGQNSPNPAMNTTMIPFSMRNNGMVQLTVVNLLGEIVINEQVSARSGNNQYNLNVNALQNGIYMYSIEFEGKKLTKRLVVNR